MFNKKQLKELERRIFALENPAKFEIGKTYKKVLIMSNEVITDEYGLFYRQCKVLHNKKEKTISEWRLSELIKNGCLTPFPSW